MAGTSDDGIDIDPPVVGGASTPAFDHDPDHVDPRVVDRVRSFMTSQWRAPGFTCPNADTYPWLWLWDSCFHSLIWAGLGRPDRARIELGSALARQRPSGFVPHVVYYDGFAGHDEFWGTPGASSITQPPVFGHTIAVLERAGIPVPVVTKRRARLAFEFLLRVRRRTPGGLVEMVHPWESGCDHSPRWDDLFIGGAAGPGPSVTTPDGGAEPDPYDRDFWFERKGQMVSALELVDGGAVSSEDCRIGSVAFNALIAFCATELSEVTGDGELRSMADELSRNLSHRWDPGLATWVDEGATDSGSGRVHTLEALLPLLTETRPEIIAGVVDQLVDPGSYWGSFGLRQVHPAEPTFDPGSYWRGASWPQLNHLFAVAARRSGRCDIADRISSASLAGALRSGFSEYWNADDGTGGGASPQSWSALPATVDPDVMN